LVIEAELSRSDGGPFLWQLTRHASSSSSSSSNGNGSMLSSGSGSGSGSGDGNGGHRASQRGRDPVSPAVRRTVLRCGASGDAVGWDPTRKAYRLRTVLSWAACAGDGHRQSPHGDAAPVLSLDMCAVRPNPSAFSRSFSFFLTRARSLSLARYLHFKKNNAFNRARPLQVGPDFLPLAKPRAALLAGSGEAGATLEASGFNCR
jgi:hypothetical protein